MAQTSPTDLLGSLGPTEPPNQGLARSGKARLVAMVLVLVLMGSLLVRMQATASEHWAFRSVSVPPVPKVARVGWPQTPVDHFVLAKLEEAGRQPAPRADRRTLIRRAFLDLTGLPPTPAEVDAFVFDPRQDAFARLVDRLLASPRYGERWGRHWLDLARFADSNGMDENLAYATAFRYRDYVVRAFNRDIPYDRFVHEQLAGDLLPAAAPDGDRSDPLMATGFLTLGPKMLAEDDPVKMEMDIVDEQLDSTCRVFMGLTAGCARCHDHKYDPVSMKDYYAMAGIFKSTRTMENFKVVARWQEVPVGPASALVLLREGKSGMERQRKQINDLVQGGTETVLAEARRRAADYLLEATERREVNKTSGSSNPHRDSGTLHPDFLAQWETYLAKTETATNSILVIWHSFGKESKSGSTDSQGAGLTEGTNAAMFRRLTRTPRLASRRELALRYEEIWLEAEQAWKKLKQAAEGPAATPKPTRLEDHELDAFREVLYSATGPFTAPKTVESLFPPKSVEELATTRRTLKELEASLPTLPEVMAVSEGTPTDLRVHKRGSHLALGEEVERGFPRSIRASSERGVEPGVSGRLQFAQWLTDPGHPLTARVIVNRIWHWHFGEGLVRSPDNFGILGERPTHSELLDWLSDRLVASGWSMKTMHRLLMNSASYQQSSANPQDNVHGIVPDPENRLLSRFARRRLEVEAVRDSLLFVSGGLNSAMGGTLLGVENRTYVTSTASKIDPALYDTPRRSIYLPVVRSALYDVFQIFDFADPSVLNGRRDQTVVAPQALFMMNSRLVADAALRLAKSLLATPGRDDAARITELFRTAYGRSPSPTQCEAAIRYVKSYGEKLGAVTSVAMDTQLRAWQSLCRITLAANEFIHLD